MKKLIFITGAILIAATTFVIIYSCSEKDEPITKNDVNPKPFFSYYDGITAGDTLVYKSRDPEDTDESYRVRLTKTSASDTIYLMLDKVDADTEDDFWNYYLVNTDIIFGGDSLYFNMAQNQNYWQLEFDDSNPMMNNINDGGSGGNETRNCACSDGPSYCCYWEHLTTQNDVAHTCKTCNQNPCPSSCAETSVYTTPYLILEADIVKFNDQVFD